MHAKSQNSFLPQSEENIISRKQGVESSKLWQEIPVAAPKCSLCRLEHKANFKGVPDVSEHLKINNAKFSLMNM